MQFSSLTEKFLVRFPFTPLKKDGSPIVAKSPSEFVAKVLQNPS